MTRWTALLGFGCVLAACESSGGGGGKELPDIEVSTLKVDFGDVNWGVPVTRDVVLRNNGELPMGLSQIVVAPDGDKGQDYEFNFSVVYDFAEVACDDGSTGDTKDVSTDGTKGSGSGSGSGSDDSGDTADTGDTGAKEIVQQVLNPGCQMPIHVTMNPIGLGEVEAGLLIVTMDEPTTQDRDLSYYRDPDEEFKIVKLEGNAVDVKGRIFFNPKKVWFGFVWAEQTAVEYTIVRNTGAGDLTISSVEMSQNCLDNNITTPATDPTAPEYVSNIVLGPDDSISIPIYYTPLTPSDVTDAPECGMKVYSDDPNAPTETVEILANQPGLSEDTPPSVTLISPAVGYSVTSGTLRVEVDMFDANQPADSLDCKVKSAILKMATIGNCTPPDASGHVVVYIDADDKLEAGVDTIEILVTDAHGQRATASTTVAYLVTPPDNDADGDLWAGVAFGGTDCDDNDATVYPGAAELPDGKDNNCEPAASCAPSPCPVPINPCIDEGTVMGDDDADCFIEYCPDVPPANGCDCNDWETYGANTFPGAPEIPDNLDNDCDQDGQIDEGTTASDDDGDGYDELNGDFRDDDPTINPAAIEYCDGVDNDCDDFIDNAGACIPIDSRPVILAGAAGVWSDRTDIGTNESTTIGVYGFDADGDTLTYVWTQDEELAPFVSVDPAATGPVVTFTAPDEIKGDGQYRYDIGVQVADPDGNLTWAYGYVWVHDGPVDLTLGTSADSSGCNTSKGNPALVPLLPLALFAWTRRRRDARAPGFAA